MKSKRKYKAVKENVEGDFYVKDGCCTMCGVPHIEAPELFGGFDEKQNAAHKQCFVKKQPETYSELEKMINAIAAQDTGCIRYCGNNEKIIQKILMNTIKLTS